MSYKKDEENKIENYERDYEEDNGLRTVDDYDEKLRKMEDHIKELKKIKKRQKKLQELEQEKEEILNKMSKRLKRKHK
ncbi:hypothetical protein [Clostridium sp. UBA6640]|uniref:hypothetical protein n=1 Tax=Clostridium sp. UBA6640 TaxID=1946370 RepID=UPI0025C4A6AC|nr:hypothetical protein [Clostridium sp. UBA6640]